MLCSLKYCNNSSLPSIKGFAVAIYLVILVGDFFGIVMLIIAASPIIGYSFLFGAQSFFGIRTLIQRKKVSNTQQEIHLVEIIRAGLLFILFLISFGIHIAVFNPQWNSNVAHTTLYAAGSGSEGYRIPSIVVLPNDIVLAFAEKRGLIFVCIN